MFSTALSYKRGKHPNASKRVRDLADSMDEETLTHYTTGSTEKLPEHVADLEKKAFTPEERLSRLHRRRGEETSIVLVAGIHGDEPAGWSTLKAFKGDPRIATIDVGNHSGKRTQDGEDLNRQFGTEDEPPDVLDTVRDANPSLVIDLHEDTSSDGAYAYCSPSIAARVKAVFRKAKGMPKAKSVEGDKAEEGVIYKGRNPKPGTLEIALESMGTPYCTIETPVVGHTLKERIAFQTKVVNMLLAEFAEPLPEAEPPTEKAAQSSVLHLLHEAKRFSDEGKYSQKAAIIHSLMVMHPEDWEVDDSAGLYVAGITHKPTQYRFHLPKSAITPGVGMAHAHGGHEPDIRHNLSDQGQLLGVAPTKEERASALYEHVTKDPAMRHEDLKGKLADLENGGGPKELADAWLSHHWLRKAAPDAPTSIDHVTQHPELEQAVGDRLDALEKRLADTGSLWGNSHATPQEEVQKSAAAASGGDGVLEGQAGKPAAPQSAPLSFTGPEAIAHALQKLDLGQVEAEARDVIARKRISKRPRAVQVLNILEGFKRNGTRPSDLMIRAVPVIPPVFRPFSVAGDTFIPGDANELYQDLFKHRDVYKRIRQTLGDAGAGDARLTMYDAVKALYGFAEPVSPKQKSRGVKGFLQTVAGSSPKFCYDDVTEVLTKEKGWVLFAELLEGVEVGTINPNTHAFEWQVPSEYTHADYAGYMAKITNGADREGRAPKLDLLVTPNHRMWSSTRTKTNPTTAAGPGKWDITEAAEWVVSPKLRRYIQLSAKDYVEGSAPQLPAGCGFVDTKDFAEFLGWWLAEGDLHTDGTACTIWQSDYNTGYCGQLDELFARLSQQGLSTSRYEKQGDGASRLASHGWAITSNRPLCDWLSKNCGHRAKNKRIPREMQLWDKEHLLLLYRGITRGDGSKRKLRKEEQVLRGRLHKHRSELTDSHHAISSTSLRLLEDLQELVFKLGIQGRITLAHEARGNQNALWDLSLVGRWFSQTETNTQVAWQWYTGKVHCCTVPNTLLVVRRNKCVAVSGNSVVQRRLLSKTQDSVGRSTVVVDPDLSLDQIGVPRDMARTMYANWVQRRLVRMGMSPADALQHLKDKTPYAERALEKEVETRPVLYSRAPSWHKFSFLAGKPKLIDGDAIAVNPLVTTGMNMDFNGDMQVGRVLLLVSNGCVSKNLFSRLTLPLAADTVLSMTRKQIIPAFDESRGSLYLVDLEDFPKGPLQRVKENGRNGIIEFYDVPPGVKVVAFDEKTQRPVWADVSFYSKHPGRLLELVDLSNGRQIVSDDDPRAVYGMDPADATMQMRRFTPTEALELRAVVPVVRDVAAACSDLHCLDSIEAAGLTIPLDWDFGYLLGALAGDGWWDKKDYGTSKRRCVYLADLKGQVAARVHVILARLFGEVRWDTAEQLKADDASRYGDTVKHTFTFKESTQFTQFLSQWLGGAATAQSAGSGAKTLPDFFMLAPEAFRKGLINGVLDTDGSCSVSLAKGQPQLLCAVTSTSLRMITDVKFLCLTLDVQAAVSFSKNTVRGNTSWICTLSAPDAKRCNLFSNLATDTKRNAFIETDVSYGKTSQIYDKVPVPDHIFSAVLRELPNPKITTEERADKVADISSRKHEQNMYQQWYQTRKSKIISRSGALEIKKHLEAIGAASELAIATAIEDLRHGEAVTAQRVALWRKAILAAAPKYGSAVAVAEGRKVYARTNKPLREGRVSESVRDSLSSWLSSFPRYAGVVRSAEFQLWYSRFVEVKEVAWAAVTGVQKTGIREDGYDLTVPGYDTFMAADGIILSNTVNMHIPASDEAVKEAHERLMPSKMLFTPRDPDRTMALPKQEMILGLHNAKLRPSRQTHVFDTENEAYAAIDRGDVPLRDEVQIRSQRPDPMLAFHPPTR